MIFICVGHFEVEPLVVTFGVDIILKDEVVGLYATVFVVFFEDEEEVTTLEIGVEYE